MSKVIKNKREDPEDFEYWIDYVMQVGTEHLRSTQYHKMEFYEYLDLEVHLALYAIVLSIILILVIIIRMNLNLCKRSANQNLKKVD